MEKLAQFIRKHPWWQWLTRTPFAAKMTKYALSSVIAFGLSEFAFAFCYFLGFSTTACSVIAFFAAAIPNWIMNRRWAWEQKGRPPAKQTIAYVIVSAVVLVVTSVTTKLTNYWVRHDHVINHHGVRILIVTGSFTVVTVILFFAKFAVYEFLIFSDDRRGGGPRGGGPRGGRMRRGDHAERERQPDAERERGPELTSGPVA